MNKPLLKIGMALALSAPLAVYAGAKEDFEGVYSEAESIHKDAGTFQWTTTSDRLSAAKSAAEGGDYDKALAIARQALKLAEESLEQRQGQAEDWRKVAIGN